MSARSLDLRAAVLALLIAGSACAGASATVPAPVPGPGPGPAPGLAPGPATGAAYQLEVSFDPPAHRLGVTATVTVPAALAGEAIEFVLASDLDITAAEPAAVKVGEGAAGDVFSGINGSSGSANRQRARRYRVDLPPGRRDFHLTYGGRIDQPPQASSEEYARSFAETPGIVDARGVYLAGSTLWYPLIVAPTGDALVTFSLHAIAPEAWHLVAPGDGTSRDGDGVAQWASTVPLDEISLAGGPLILSSAAAGAVQAQVFLHEPDKALAARYLDATRRYLRMYAELIGAYPYGKFALVENFWDTGYGMPSYTLLGPQVIRMPYLLTSSYPHEVLHNWWGNSVFVDYRTGNWAEGLTAYLADHLMKEVEGTGAEYRRDVLKKYRDYVNAGAADFPLREFRSRHSPVTEAVGYGKALMGFHELRRMLGDDAFKAGLRGLYSTHRGQRAGFDDVRRAFEQASGLELDAFFDELTSRTGAPDLVFDDADVERTRRGWTVSGVLRQRQAAPFQIDVPVALATETGLVLRTIASNGPATAVSIDSDARPLALAIDPEFDVFRLLHARETAPGIGQLFGASRVTVVLPSEPAEEAAIWREAVERWRGARDSIDVVIDRDLRQLPGDRAVWVVGRNNGWASRLFEDDERTGLRIDGSSVSVGAEALSLDEHSLVLVRRHPADDALAVAWVTASTPAAIPGLARKLPHYGKYSWLVFSGDEPTNIARGEWPAVDSPLLVDLRGRNRTTAPASTTTLPKRTPLAEPPAAFAPADLKQHVDFLAAPEREGRGPGSRGIDAASDYIARQLESAGVQPGGADGRWFQTFTTTAGPAGAATRLRNVIGVLPGVNPEFAGQAVLLTAHYDHLGFGASSPSGGPRTGARAGAVGALHPGADDNASGVAVLIEVARRFAASPSPPRTIVFVAFSGEEAGLLGSRHYVEHPLPAPVDGIVGVVNLDTVGRLGAQPVSVLATDSAREWPFLFSGISAVTGIPTRSVPGASQSSDQQSFIAAGVPAVQLFATATLDYHRPTDTPDKIDAEGMARVAIVASEAMVWLASTDKRLTRASAAAAPQPGTSRRVSLGAIPDFAHTAPGVRLEGVVPASPAATAGLQSGDILIRLGDEEIADLAGFNRVLADHSPGDRVHIAWMRAGAQLEAEVELVAR